MISNSIHKKLIALELSKIGASRVGMQVISNGGHEKLDFPL